MVHHDRRDGWWAAPNDEATRAERVGWTRITRDDGKRPLSKSALPRVRMGVPDGEEKRFKEAKKDEENS